MEGTVTDNYTKNPVADIPLVITRAIWAEYYQSDTIITDQNGYYYYEFLTDTIDTQLLSYESIETLKTEFYNSTDRKWISVGRKNRIDISIIPIIH